MKTPISFALFGGTFDPAHNGHRMVMQTVLREGHAKKIYATCAHQNPFTCASRSGKGATDPWHRFQMLRLACSDIEGVEVSDTELRAQKPSYTINTVRAYLAKNKCKQMGLIVGSDIIDTIWKWKDASELSTLVTLIVYPRPQYEVWKTNEMDSTCGKCSFRYVMLDDVPICDISSEMLRKSRDIHYLSSRVPEKVFRYIKRNKLYAASQ